MPTGDLEKCVDYAKQPLYASYALQNYRTLFKAGYAIPVLGREHFGPPEWAVHQSYRPQGNGISCHRCNRNPRGVRSKLVDRFHPVDISLLRDYGIIDERCNICSHLARCSGC